MSGESFRIERDSLGAVEVPAQALYGAQTQRAIANFPISGLTMPRPFLRALGLVKAACAKVNGDLRLLERPVAEAIERAANAVAAGDYDDQFPVDVFQTGSGTSTNMNANEVIARLAGESLGQPVHPNDHVNMGQSSNDVIPATIHLSAVLMVRDQLKPGLSLLADSIAHKAATLSGVVKTGRTHLMDAMPVGMDQEMGGWAAQLRHGIQRIDTTLPRLEELPLGATAVGTGINAHPEFGRRAVDELRQVTGLALRPHSNPFEALSAPDAAVELSGQLKTLASSLMKISNDLRWMNSGPLAGLAEISLPALQPGSSIMPGKVNPVIPEAVTMVCAQVMGNDVTITIAGQSGNFQLNVMLPVIAYNLLQSISLLANASGVLALKAIEGFEVNEQRIREVLARNPILVTALNSVIGYEQGAAIAKRAYAEGRPVIEVAREVTGLDEEELRRLLDPARLIRGGLARDTQ